LDRIIVTSRPESLPEAIKVIRFGGIITFLGLHFGCRGVVALDVNDLIFRKITLRPISAEPALDFPTSLRLLQQGQVDPGMLITHTFGFAGATEILRSIIDESRPIIKAVMLPNG
jgi:L-iditol 2-dehydrogenase